MTLRLHAAGADALAPGFELRATPLGCVLRVAGGPPRAIEVTQGALLAVGAACAAGALALAGPRAAGLVSGGLAVVLASLALLLVWFSTRGASVELHFDLPRRELRELVRHRIGRASLVARHPIGPDPTLHALARDDGTCALVLRHGEAGEGLCIVEGPQDAVLALRRHLDLVLRGPAWSAPARLAA